MKLCIVTRHSMAAILLTIPIAMGGSPALAENETVVFIATQRAGDQGPIDGIVAGLEQAEAEFGVETRVIEALDPATYENTLRTLAGRGTDIVVAPFFGMGAAVQNVAPEYPDTKFIVIVGAPHEPTLPNARVTVYATQENAYLAGTYAAGISGNGQLGLIAGVPMPFVWADYNAMSIAAQAVNPDAKVTTAFVQSFEDPVKAKEVASSLYDQGVDVIYTGAAASDFGVVEATAETGNTVIVASPALVDRAPENTGLVVTFEWARTLMIELENALSDNYQPGFRIGNIGSGEIVMTFPEGGARDDAEARARTEAVYQQIQSGELVVPYDDTEPK